MADMPNLDKNFSFQHFQPAQDKSAEILHEAWGNMAKNALSSMQHKDRMKLEDKKIAIMQSEENRMIAASGRDEERHGLNMKIDQNTYDAQVGATYEARMKGELEQDLANTLFWYGDGVDDAWHLEEDPHNPGNMKMTYNNAMTEKISAVNQFDSQALYDDYSKKVLAKGGNPMSLTQYMTLLNETSKGAASNNLTKLSSEFMEDARKAFPNLTQDEIKTKLDEMINANPEFSGALEAYWLSEAGITPEDASGDWFNTTLSEAYDTENYNAYQNQGEDGSTVVDDFETKTKDVNGTQKVDTSRTITGKDKELAGALLTDAVEDQQKGFWADDVDEIKVREIGGKLWAIEKDSWAGRDTKIEVIKVDGELHLKLKDGETVPIKNISQDDLHRIFEGRWWH